MEKFKNLKQRISLFYVEDNALFVVDEINRVIEFDENLLLKRGFKLKFIPNRPSERAVKIDNDILAIGAKNYISVWDLKSKKHLANFKREDEVLSVGIDKNYMVSGGTNGKIELYNLKILSKVATLAKHRDFINDLAIDSDMNEVYAGCYDKAVLFINSVSFIKKERYLHIKEVKKIEKKDNLISADKISDIIKWNVFKQDKKDRVDFYKEFRDFWIDEDFLVVLGQNKIMVYDLEKEVILNDNFLEVGKADKIVVFGKFLLFSDLNGVIFKVDLFKDERLLLDYILKEDFKSAYELIDKNPFLRRSAGFNRLERMVELIIKRAKQLFETDRTEAIKLLDKLLVVPQLRSKIEEIIKHFSEIVKFKHAIKSGNYALAYMLANSYPLLKETKYYEILEKKWQFAFEKALRLINEGKISEAKEILEPFMAVPEKLPLIEFLLKKAEIIRLLREKLAKRDFKGFFDLVKTHPELKLTKEYMNVLKYAQNLYKKAQELIKQEEFEKAKKVAAVLIEIEPFKDKGYNILKRAEIGLKFLEFLAQKEYEKAIELAEMYTFLKELKSYKEFMKQLNEDFQKAEMLIKEGKTTEAFANIEKYRNRFLINRINEISKIS